MVWQSLTYLESHDIWRATTPNVEIELPGSATSPDSSAEAVAQRIASNFVTLEANARSLLKTSVNTGTAWTVADAECDSAIVTPHDSWEADFVLVYRVPDYVTLYVGFRDDNAFYVLQRIE